jgi:hypothetical protein
MGLSFYTRMQQFSAKRGNSYLDDVILGMLQTHTGNSVLSDCCTRSESYITFDCLKEFSLLSSDLCDMLGSHVVITKLAKLWESGWLNRHSDGLAEWKDGIGFPARSGAHASSYPMGTQGSFLGDKTVGVWNWPLTSISVPMSTMMGLYFDSFLHIHGV